MTGTMGVTVQYHGPTVDASFFLVDSAVAEATMDLMQKLGVTVCPTSGKVFTVQEEEDATPPPPSGATSIVSSWRLTPSQLSTSCAVSHSL